MTKLLTILGAAIALTASAQQSFPLSIKFLRLDSVPRTNESATLEIKDVKGNVFTQLEVVTVTKATCILSFTFEGREEFLGNPFEKPMGIVTNVVKFPKTSAPPPSVPIPDPVEKGKVCEDGIEFEVTSIHFTNSMQTALLVSLSTNWTGCVINQKEAGIRLTNYDAQVVFELATNVFRLKTVPGDAMVWRDAISTFTNSIVFPNQRYFLWPTNLIDRGGIIYN